MAIYWKIWTQVYLSWNQRFFFFFNIENICLEEKKSVYKTSYLKMLQFFLIIKIVEYYFH
jgi:hypothetical protein